MAIRRNDHNESAPQKPEICLEDHYAAAALTGVLAAQNHEPSKEWAQNFCLTLGEAMARAARQRRRRR